MYQSSLRPVLFHQTISKGRVVFSFFTDDSVFLTQVDATIFYNNYNSLSILPFTIDDIPIYVENGKYLAMKFY